MPDKKDRSGAESLVQAFVDAEADVCFANPGTSEMHFVAALDNNPEMRCVLGLFEGVVTGAADGYARMARKPAVTLTHLGPGLGNGLANLHNAKKARTPVVNVVGEHATYHRKYDAPLTSDVAGFAAPVSGWVKVSESADSVAADGAEAVQASTKPPGQVATLILPADTAWNRTTASANPLPRIQPKAYSTLNVDNAANVLKSGEPSVILMNGELTKSRSAMANQIGQVTGARILMDTFVGRVHRGAGTSEVARLPYFGEMAAEVLNGTRHLILLGTQAPVTFFAYPDKPNYLTPEGCELHVLAERDEDIDGALEALMDAVGADKVQPIVTNLEIPGLPSGELNQRSAGTTLAHYLPENAIIVDEGGMNGGGSIAATRTGKPHDWLILTGGAIGFGLPCATGAAVACPEQRVISLQADGSGMYTNQALWTQAREGLNITTILFANQRYGILQVEFGRVGAHNPGPKAMSMLDLTNPELQWTDIAKGMGVPAWRVTTVEEYADALEKSFATPGPALIEVMVP